MPNRPALIVWMGLVGCAAGTTDLEPGPGSEAPTAVILSPPDGAMAPVTGEASIIDFSGGATDLEDADDCCDLEWSSDLDGVLGRGGQLARALTTVGLHEITLTAYDSDGNTGTATITVEAVYGPPTVELISPQADAFVRINDWVALEGAASDLAVPEGLDDSAFVWDSTVGTDPFPVAGRMYGVRLDTAGPRTLSLTVTSPSGEVATETVLVEVQPEEAEAPTVTIELPTPQQILEADQVHFLRSDVTSNFSGGGINIQADGWAIDHDGAMYDIDTTTIDAVHPETVLPLGLCGDRPATIVRWWSDRGGKTTKLVPVVVRYPDCP